MSHDPPVVLISDADVLIDYAGADMEVLEIIATSLWQLHVAMPILREVRALSVERAMQIGIIICEPTLEEITEAAARGGSLSEPDRLCLVIARKRGWPCLTNDLLLRQSCRKAGVRLVWGLEAMVLLYKAGRLSRAKAVRTAEAIHKTNPHHIHQVILDRFLKHLDA